MTNLGRAKEAAAFASATTVEITHIAIGDGATVPSGGETALYNEVARKTISNHGTVAGADNVAYFDCFLAAEEGPYTIREAGLYDVDGDLIAIAHYDPPISKPTPASGQTVEGTIRLEVAFSNIANITIVVDPSMQVALQRLTRLPWIPIISMSLATPPASPVAGDTYLIASSPTGSWAGQAGKVAEYTNAGWAIITPPDGHGVSLPDGRVFERVSGAYVEKIALDSQSGKWVYAADSGTADALVVTLAPVPVAYTTGMALRIKAANSNTGPATLNVNGLGVKAIKRRDGTALLSGDIVAGSVQDYVYDGVAFQMPAAEGKPIPSANLDIYVNTTLGNDANDGTANTSGKALKTIQAGVNLAFSYAPSQYTITIHVADGTYSESVSTPSTPGPAIIIDGNSTTPANVLITSSSGSCFTVLGPNTATVRNLKVACSNSSSAGLAAQGAGSSLTTSNTESGVVAGWAFLATNLGLVNVGTHKFTASAAYGFAAYQNGLLYLVGSSVFTISTTITVTAFALVVANGSISVPAASPTFVNPGNVTGLRYAGRLNGTIDSAGIGTTYFPGASNSMTSGAQYV
jgi:hypothetical protein